MSPLSSNAQDDVDDTGMVDISAPESPAVERPPKTPPQPFNFGLLSKEMMGMKITHAADMDTRLGNIETRTLQLERVVDKLCHTVPGVKRPVDPRDMALPSNSRRSLDTDTHSQVSAGEYPAYPSALRPPSSKNKPPAITATPLSLSSNRPTSGSTVRGAASLPTLGRNDGSAAPQDEVVAKLRADLDAERAARQALEAQVKKLSERLNTLSTTMFAMVRGPSESRSHERLAPPSSVGGSSPLPLTPKRSLLAPPLIPREQLSVFESDDDDEGGEEVGSQPVKKQARADLEEGETTEDDFQTPREVRTPMVGYGAFGEELRPEDDGGDGDGDDPGEDDPKRKKAARTLSLSQLTLGKGQRMRI